MIRFQTILGKSVNRKLNVTNFSEKVMQLFSIIFFVQTLLMTKCTQRCTKVHLLCCMWTKGYQIRSQSFVNILKPETFHYLSYNNDSSEQRIIQLSMIITESINSFINRDNQLSIVLFMTVYLSCPRLSNQHEYKMIETVFVYLKSR